MRRFGLLWLVLTLVIAGGAAALGYQMGVSGTSVPIWVGFGLGFFGWFPFLLILLLLFAVLGRFGRFGHRGWHGGYGRHGYGGMENRLRDWHQKEHGEKPEASTEKVSV